MSGAGAGLQPGEGRVAPPGDLGDENGSRRALSCVCPFSSSSSSEERVLWMPEVGSARGCALTDPPGVQALLPVLFSALSAQRPLSPMGAEGEGAAAPLAGLGGSRELGLFWK